MAKSKSSDGALLGYSRPRFLSLVKLQTSRVKLLANFTELVLTDDGTS